MSSNTFIDNLKMKTHLGNVDKRKTQRLEKLTQNIQLDIIHNFKMLRNNALALVNTTKRSITQWSTLALKMFPEIKRLPIRISGSVQWLREGVLQNKISFCTYYQRPSLISRSDSSSPSKATKFVYHFHCPSYKFHNFFLFKIGIFE